MKRNKIILSIVLVILVFVGCDDQVMDWKTPDGYNSVNRSEIPLALAEKIANYDFIKAYAPERMTIGIGLGAELYMEDPEYKKVADENFQMITTGNAMKHSSVVKNDGSLDFTTIDAFFQALPAEMKVMGHNLIWHTQQRQAYLKSLIAPEVVIESNPDDVLENVVENSDFESGSINPWNSWGNGSSRSISEQGAGYQSDYALVLKNPTDASSYSAQAAYDLSNYLEKGVTYVFQFMAKSNSPAGELQVQVQNNKSYGSQEGYNTFDVGTSWVLCQSEFTCSFEDVNRLLINFGKIAGDYYIDDFKFGKKKTGPTNYMPNGSFENGTEGWTLQNPGAGIEVVTLEDAPAGKHVIKMTASDTSEKEYELQIISSEMPSLHGEKVRLSFFVKADQSGKGRVSFSGLSNNYPWMDWTGSQGSWTGAFEVGTSWQQISVVIQNFNNDFKEGDPVWKCNFDFGYLPNVTYYIDDIRVVVEENAPATRSTRAAGGISYIYKTPEEKKVALLGAMEEWIKGMLQHCGDRVQGWDVINEPIADNNLWRGVEGNFMSNGPDEEADTTPVEENGLHLNWGNDHFYWGYYIGKEYAVKAFEYARKYAPQGTPLFVNEYNLESNPAKLTALIEFVNYIDQHGATVDGIGTQMHVSADTTANFKSNVDNMFKTLAATGKIIRVTELDVRLGTASPSAGQLNVQAETYRYIAESYMKHVPEAQQSGITIWSLTDHPREHEYWLPDESPNLFDKDYKRKPAYKGFCDGLAGRDVSEDFSGEDYVNAYKNKDKQK